MITEVNNANGSTQISKYSYTYYVDGNQKSKTESVAGTNKGTTNYTYDGLNRFVSEQAPDKTYSYQYDSYGNRSQLSVTGDENYATSYTYDKNNSMRNQTKTAGTAKEITDFWYDPNGNQISSMTISTGGTGTAGAGIELAGGNTNSYSEYDSWNQLTKTMQNGKTASYTYNGDGLRMSKTVNGTKTSHIWDGTNIAGDVTNGTVTKYIRGLQLISSKKGSNESFYTYNGHGDVVQLTNGTGSITKQYSYDAFGVEIGKADNDTNPFRYCGEYYDTDTDSVYLRARYYASTTGRFITEDPIKDGTNWYAYAGNNPVMFVDPSGLEMKIEDYHDWYKEQLDILSDDTLEIDEYGYVLITNYVDNPDAATSLVRRIINDSKMCVLTTDFDSNLPYATSYSNQNEDGKLYGESGGTITINPNIFNISKVTVEGGKKETVPTYIGIAHELIHILRAMGGNHKNYQATFLGKRTNAEELDTVGLNYTYNNTYFDAGNWYTTENSIRDLFGLKRRVAYF